MSEEEHMASRDLKQAVGGVREPAERGSEEWISAWKCCGCGQVYTTFLRSCDCPTQVLGRGGRGYSEQAVKIEPKELVEAAAPDLLAALEELERWVTEDSDCKTQAQRHRGRMALLAARAAIRKALVAPTASPAERLVTDPGTTTEKAPQ